MIKRMIMLSQVKARRGNGLFSQNWSEPIIISGKYKHNLCDHHSPTLSSQNLLIADCGKLLATATDRTVTTL